MLLTDWLHEERGRSAALAAALKVPASLISKMASGEKAVPLAHCPYIEAFTTGAVTCEELRPDRTEYFAMLRGRPFVLRSVVTPKQLSLVGERADA
jgi:DNA-binding transcriptional regulator YdaS (Cro superfamily)